MIIRSLALAGGLAGAAATSQFPEFSQQYIQRLGGAVDALGQVVADFDTSATAVGLTRDEALAQMTGTEFLDRRRDDMSAAISRHTRLQNALATLQDTGPFMRAYNITHLTDRKISQAAWTAFEPAVPLNFAGLIFAAVGFVLGGGLLRLLLGLLAWPFRRAKPA